MTTPSAGSAGTSPGSTPGIQILTAEKVTVPIVMAPAGTAGTPAAASQDAQRLRADFLAGKDLSKADMATMLSTVQGRSTGNGNCNIC